MRDRLIELMRDCCNYTHCLGKKDLSICINQCARVSELANHLISEGVIVPPCKVGQTVYCIRYDKTRKAFVKPLGVLSISAYGKGNFTVFTTKEDTWGITAFATAEKAEKALERSENGK